jgi:hypothetical protein
MAYKTQLLAYHLRRKPIVVFPMEHKEVTWMISTKNVQYSTERPDDVKILKY